jgi:hypothetical protein
VLYIKKEKVLDKRALKGAADNGTTDNNGPVFKEIRPVKLDFSATNFKSKVTGWRLSIENKADTLFPTICDTARGIAGIPAATADQLEHQDPQILARANLASEDEDSSAEHEKENTQAIEEHADIFDEHRDNGVTATAMATTAELMRIATMEVTTWMAMTMEVMIWMGMTMEVTTRMAATRKETTRLPAMTVIITTMITMTKSRRNTMQRTATSPISARTLPALSRLSMHLAPAGRGFDVEDSDIRYDYLNQCWSSSHLLVVVFFLNLDACVFQHRVHRT